MSLPDLLSAMRTLILDDAPPDGGLAARRACLHERFPDLTETEIADLANVPPERMGVYTNLVFAGERGMLRWIFPKSLEAVVRLKRIGGEARDEGDILYDLTRDLHRTRPWHNSSQRALAANFQSYALEHLRDLTDAWPGLVDLINFERTELDVFYALDFAGRAIDVAELAELSVGDLLAKPVARPPYIVPKRYTHDVLSIHETWHEDGALPDALPPANVCLTVCGRSPANLMPAWLRLDEQEFAAISAAPAGVFTDLNTLATAYIESAPPDTFADEAQAFEAFLIALARWAHAGVLYLGVE